MLLFRAIAVIEAQHKSEFKCPKDIPYLTLTGKLCSVYCEEIRENWPCYNVTLQLYVQMSTIRFADDVYVSLDLNMLMIF